MDTSWLLVVLISLLSLKECFGIRCYICSYPDNKRCGDQFLMTNQDAVECAGGTCTKKRGYKDDASLVKNLYIVRGCDLKTREECYQDSTHGFSGDKCTCNRDYCNGTVSLKHFNYFSILLAVFTSIFINFKSNF